MLLLQAMRPHVTSDLAIIASPRLFFAAKVPLLSRRIQRIRAISGSRQMLRRGPAFLLDKYHHPFFS